MRWYKRIVDQISAVQFKSIPNSKMRFFILSVLLVSIYFFGEAQSQTTIALLSGYKNCCPKLDILFDLKDPRADCRIIPGGLPNVHWLPGDKPKCGIAACGDGKWHKSFTCGVGECNWASCECVGGCVHPGDSEEALANFNKTYANKIVSARLTTWTDV